MAEKEERKSQILGLMQRNGLDFTCDHDSYIALTEWILQHAEPNPQDPERLRNLWYAVVNDLGLLLGDCAIQEHPNLRWEMWTRAKRDAFYHRHVITGRPGPKRAPVDFDGLVAVVAHRAIAGMPVERDDLAAAMAAMGH